LANIHYCLYNCLQNLSVHLSVFDNVPLPSQTLVLLNAGLYATERCILSCCSGYHVLRKLHLRKFMYPAYWMPGTNNVIYRATAAKSIRLKKFLGWWDDCKTLWWQQLKV